jgi:cell pole-organizing protein PopZ
MAQQNDPNRQDPAMEDILASIRRIISEDEPAAAEATDEADDTDEEPLELTERVDAPPVAAAETPAAPAPAVTESMAGVRTTEGLIDIPGPAATVAPQAQAQGKTLEALASEMLRPMLKAWVDEHMEAVVRSAVDAEVARIFRQGR